MDRWYRSLIGLGLVAVLVFYFWPDLDIVASRQFVVDGRFNARLWYYDLVLYGIPYVTLALVIGFLCVIGLSFCGVRLAWFPRRIAVFLLLSLSLGPGLLVNVLLKDQLGRPRPVQTINFGGKHAHVRPFVPSNACYRNCSFVSGHASMGFYLLSFAFVFPKFRRKWVGIGLVAGGAIGYVRMAQGGHFLSDVVFAFFAVYLAAYAAFRMFVWWYRDENCLQHDGPVLSGSGKSEAAC